MTVVVEAGTARGLGREEQKKPTDDASQCRHPQRYMYRRRGERCSLISKTPPSAPLAETKRVLPPFLLVVMVVAPASRARKARLLEGAQT
jgi:hypothetical protein